MKIKLKPYAEGQAVKTNRRRKIRRSSKDRRHHNATVLAPDKRNGKNRRTIKTGASLHDS